MRSHNSGAIAIFVKTPGFSPIKTRLASSIGVSAAERFHLLSAKAIESVVLAAFRADSACIPYWAVAEKEAVHSPYWKSFQTLWQGEGTLGERLARVYDELLQRHSYVIFIGADSPHITSHLLGVSALTLSEAKDAATFVIGRAEDGGFYLFGGAVPVSYQTWLGVPYSTSTTASELIKKVSAIGTIKELPPLLDVDTADDMAQLLQMRDMGFDLTPEQQSLLRWVEEYFA